MAEALLVYGFVLVVLDGKEYRKDKLEMCNHDECPYRKHCKFSPDYDPEYESDWENKFGWILPENVDEMEECYSFLDA